MNEFAIFALSALTFVMVLHCVVTAVWAFGLRRQPLPLLNDGECPPATVVLCLRGTDPFLEDCLAALLDQDYPNYDVRVVVDSEQDPAWPVAKRVLAQSDATNVRVEVLADRRQTCSLKCSSLIQVYSSLNDDCEFVAQLDADTVPHRSWLRELATPLANENVGATTGNRWYMPSDASWGSLIRYSWNAAAVVQMYLYNIGWGGTLAIKTKVVRESDLLDRWSRALCEDTMVFGALKTMKLRLVFVPSLTMVNRESCSVGSFYRWMRRQLLTARLYHPQWLAVVGHGLLAGFATVGTFIALLIALAAQNVLVAKWLAGGFVLYQIVMLLLWPVMESAVRNIVRARCETSDWVTAKKFANFVMTNVVMQFIYPVGLISAMLLRRVDWRGVTYRVGGPWDVELLEYRPFEESKDQVTRQESL
jgi:cellulose synthase/poly-beta-1,6-N-acetylglucosamine synthase-like glycosyltransferase